MNPSCSRCNKIVYPTEKVNCLDKYWHKGCFSCEVCKMTLNMKNYKGFEKKPYCSQHYPKTGFTSVADTPENLRLAQQSKMQSQGLCLQAVGVQQALWVSTLGRFMGNFRDDGEVLYKEEFEKNKGKGFSVVADTPELQRIKKSQDQISNIKYHEEFEKGRMGGEALPAESNAHKAYQPTSPTSPQNYNYEPQPARSAAAPPPPSGGKRYRAIYDYAAADEDEVSFADGDVIMDVQQIDEGWMFGRVERTGQQGMLPANYVEAI
ncbi:LIM and SH3 domain protein 1 [Silurus asotus]|uniref:LIM and SH3 domain protein 1 n=1 Tax=Silurus asotus TaxID=30991 RepID=A0AAD5FJ78_SILAS|nr:LIM and SH3 domain protein 1 [Silurus asotus]